VEVVDDEGEVDPPVDEVCEVDPPVDVDVPVAFPPVPPGLPLPPLPPPQAARTSAAPRVAPETGARDESRLRMTHLLVHKGKKRAESTRSGNPGHRVVEAIRHTRAFPPACCTEGWVS